MRWHEGASQGHKHKHTLGGYVLIVPRSTAAVKEYLAKRILDLFGGDAHNRPMTDSSDRLTPYEDWVAAATSHLYGSLDTARDELERDRDFLDEYFRSQVTPSPEGATRQECIREAMRRFLLLVNADQES